MHLNNWLPFLDTLQNYNRKSFRSDFVAALTVALVALPQAMAYALIAGVEPKYGIYAVIVGSIIGGLFGSSRHLHTGPVNASSIVIASAMVPFLHDENSIGIVFLLAFMAGLFQMAGGVLKLGNLTQFLSRSVLVGFTAGASLLIIINQIPNFLGLPHDIGPSVFTRIRTIQTTFDQVDLTTFCIGAGTIIFVIFLNRISPKSSTGVSYLPSSLFAIIIASTIVALSELDGNGVAVVGFIPRNLPPLSMPGFDVEKIQLLARGALALTVISTSEAIASAKSIAARTGEKIDANHELIGQGLAKIGVGFLSGMPVSGSFTRTALNYRAGARTRFAAVFSGLILIPVVVLFSPITRYIPVAAIAGIIMVIATKMVSWQQVVISLRTTKSDAVVMVVTFASTLLFPLDTAIFIGVGLSLILFLRKAQHPRLIELVYDETEGFQEVKPAGKLHIPEISIIHLEGDMFFGSAEFFERQIAKVANRPGLMVLILRVKGASCLDATSMISLMQFVEIMKKDNKQLIISGVTGEVEKIFRRAGLDKAIGEENIFFSDVTVLSSTKQALQRALQYVNEKGEQKYRVRLYYEKPTQAQLSAQQAKEQNGAEPDDDSTGNN